MFKKVFKGKVNGKEYSNEQEFHKALSNALKNEEDINASSWYEKQQVPDEQVKNTDVTTKDKEVDRFASNLKKFNDKFENFLTEKEFNPFKLWDLLF